MALYSNTRIQLRLLVSRLCNDLIKGTVTSPEAGAFVCAEADWEKADDYFNDWIEVFCYESDDGNAGTSGNPTDWENITPTFLHKLTFLPEALLAAGDLVEMHREFSVETYNDFINIAIDMIAEHALLNKVDESVPLATDGYQYILATDFLYVDKIFMESATTGVFDMEKPIDPRYWRVVKKTAIKLEFVKELWSPTDGRKLRITGLASPSKLDTDIELCPVNPAFIANQAAALLHQSRVTGLEGWHFEQMKLCQAMADKIKAESPSMNVSLGGARPVVEG